VTVPRWFGGLLCASVCLASAGALAQAAPPAVSQLLIDPKDDAHLALTSNFGLMVSRDAGATWAWLCKAGLGYKGTTEPAVAILNGGALVLGLSTGVVTGDAAGCDFKPASGIDANVVGVAAIAETPGAALAVSVSFPHSSSRLWRSLDGGRGFRAVGEVLPDFTALSLVVPTASPNRVYMTGLLWARAVAGAFAVSDDGGKTFTITALANSDSGAQPFVAGVNPKRADTVYLRFTGLPGRLRVSDDAGRTFREVLSIPGALQGFAISPGGDEVFASSLEAGTYRADTASLNFKQVACEGLPCLAATDTALLGCGTRSRDGFVVGRSVDDGRSFAVLLDTPCLVPARCGPSTSVGAMCGAEWARVTARLDQVGAPCDRTAASKPFSRACFNEAKTRPTIDTAPVPSVRALGQPSMRTLVRGAGCGCVLGGAERVDWRLEAFSLLFAAFALRGPKALRRRLEQRISPLQGRVSKRAGNHRP
jgi:hypothetical protein